MARICIGIGVLLVVLALLFYFGLTAQGSPTALIPGAFGVILIILGGIGLNESRRKAAMHIAVIVALLAVIAALARPVMKTVQGEPVDWGSLPVVEQLLMAGLSLVFLILAVRSFITARGGLSQDPESMSGS